MVRFHWGKGGDGAANGNIERDLSGTNVVSFANPALIGGALSFIDRGAGDEVALKSAMSDQDFESRYDRLRYDAPSLGPVNLSVTKGVGYVYTPVKWLNLYPGYNNHSLDRRSGNYDDVNTVLVGSRLKF